MVIVHYVDYTSSALHYYGEYDVLISEEKSKNITAAELIKMVMDSTNIEKSGWLCCGEQVVPPQGKLEEVSSSWGSQAIWITFPAPNKSDSGDKGESICSKEGTHLCTYCNEPVDVGKMDEMMKTLKVENEELQQIVQETRAYFEAADGALEQWAKKYQEKEEEAEVMDEKMQVLEGKNEHLYECLLEAKHNLEYRERVYSKKLAKVEERSEHLLQTLQDTEHSLELSQEALQKSQKAADLWNLLSQSMEKTALKRLLEELAHSQKEEEEECSKKKAYHRDELGKYEAKAKKAHERFDSMQKLVEMVEDDEEEEAAEAARLETAMEHRF